MPSPALRIVKEAVLEVPIRRLPSEPDDVFRLIRGATPCPLRLIVELGSLYPVTGVKVMDWVLVPRAVGLNV